MTAPLLSDSFARARDHEALAQRMVADVHAHPGSLTYLLEAHVDALKDLSDTAMAWWLYRTWFMLARREVKALQHPEHGLLVHPKLAESVVFSFVQGPPLTQDRAEIVHLLAAQTLPFQAMGLPLFPGSHSPCLANFEDVLARAPAPHEKSLAFRRWSHAVIDLPRPLLAVALQRILDPEQFFAPDSATPHGHMSSQTGVWVNAPGWTQAELAKRLAASWPEGLWAVFRPLVEASFPAWPDLGELEQSLGVPLMAPPVPE